LKGGEGREGWGGGVGSTRVRGKGGSNEKGRGREVIIWRESQEGVKIRVSMELENMGGGKKG